MEKFEKGQEVVVAWHSGSSNMWNHPRGTITDVRRTLLTISYERYGSAVQADFRMATQVENDPAGASNYRTRFYTMEQYAALQAGRHRTGLLQYYGIELRQPRRRVPSPSRHPRFESFPVLSGERLGQLVALLESWGEYKDEGDQE